MIAAEASLRLGRLIALALSFALAGCALHGDVTPPPSELDALAQRMTGTFSSAAQAEADPENYFDIRLVMLPIWPERDDGPWLYVEQASTRALERPYRQRVYRLSRQGEAYRSEVYELPGDPLRHAGAWSRGTGLLTGVKPRDLRLREGCAIVMELGADGRFVGETGERSCVSTLRGAAFATSEVVIEPDRLTSWDRGWDAKGQQAWGATEGAYVFDRTSSGPPD